MRAPIPRPNLVWRGFVLGGVGALKVLSLSDAAWEWWEDHVTDAVPRSVVRGALAGTVVLHVAEAAAARRWARRAGLDHAAAWTRTTALYGFPELILLRRAVAADRAGTGSSDALAG